MTPTIRSFAAIGRLPFALLLSVTLLAGTGTTLSATGESQGATVSAKKKPRVYLLDPGLEGLAVRPSYISFKPQSQTFTWIRDISWRSWGGETARGRGTLEVCSFGHCRRAAADVRLWRRRPLNCPTGSSYTRITYVASGRTITRLADPYICESD